MVHGRSIHFGGWGRPAIRVKTRNDSNGPDGSDEGRRKSRSSSASAIGQAPGERGQGGAQGQGERVDEKTALVDLDIASRQSPSRHRQLPPARPYRRPRAATSDY